MAADPIRLILHDLPPGDAAARLPAGEHDDVFPAAPAVRHCVGCFQCWLRTPGICAIPDRAQDFARRLGRAASLTVISRLVFGGFSPEVKAVLDRSIGYMLPYFRMYEGQMHHTMRYMNRIALRYIFYADEISDREKETARSLAEANARNLGAGEQTAVFCRSKAEIGGAL